jgi:flagellar biosynthesis component FlhA/type III secretion system FlhB-like substrate exporter
MSPETRKARKVKPRQQPKAVAQNKARPAAKRNGRAPADLGWLRRAEAVLVNGLTIALALEYSPGTTPVVLGACRNKAAEDVVWAAQALGLPIIEVPGLEPGHAEQFKVGEEIPEAWYRPIAHALAMLYKSTPVPELVRFVRPVDRSGRPRSLTAAIAEFEDVLSTPPVSVDVGPGLADYLGDFEEPVHLMRQRIAHEMGLLLPPVPIRAHPQVRPNAFVIKFRDVPMQEGEIDLPVDSPEKLYALSNRLKQLLYEHGWELLGYLEVETELELIRKKSPGLVKAIFPTHFTVSALRQVLRNLLREQLSIRDLGTILEVILENLPRSQDPDLLTECVRIAYSRSLCHKFKDGEGYVNVVTLDPAVERILREAVTDSGGVRWMDLSPDDALRVLQATEATLKQVARLNLKPVILVSPALRRFLARLVEDIFRDVPVLSYSEIAPLTEVRSVGTIRF